jgi:hypothetical protein
VTCISPTSQNYDRFANRVKKKATSHKAVDWKIYLAFSKENADLYEEYVTMFEVDSFSEETTDKGKKVMESISQERRESTDMSKNSKKALSTIRKLRGDPKLAHQQPK